MELTRFVVVGGARVLSSPDGQTWGIGMIHPSISSANQIAYGNGTYVVAAASNGADYFGRILVSTDLVNWEDRWPAGLDKSGTLAGLSVFFAADRFVACLGVSTATSFIVATDFVDVDPSIQFAVPAVPAPSPLLSYWVIAQ